MNAIGMFFRQNKKIFYTAVSIWVMGAVCAVFCAAHINGSLYEDVHSFINYTFNQKSSFITILKNIFTRNLLFMLTIMLASSHTVMIPLTLAVVSFGGFSTALTSTFFIRVYGWQGALSVFVSVVLPRTLSLGAYFAMAVCALRYPLLKRDFYKRGLAPEKQLFTSHILTILTLFGYLCAVSVIEAFLSLMLFRIN